MFKNRLILILLLLQSINAIISQENSLINQIINKSSKGESYSTDLSILVNQTNSVTQLSVIEELIESKNIDTRYLAYQIIYRVGKQVSDQKVTQRAVYILVSRGLTDEEATIRIRNIELLGEFNENDFSQQSRSSLAAIIIDSKTNTTELTRLAGHVKLIELVTIFEQRLITSKNKKEVWLIHCSLARMGDPVQKEYCLSRFKSLGFNDEIIQNILPDLLFTENRDVIDYLLDSILIDNLNCSSFNPDSSERVNCAFRLIEKVSPYVENFPVKVGESGDLEVSDYDEALSVVRQWITEYRATYNVRF